MHSSAPKLLGSTTPRVFTAPLVTGPAGPCGCGCALTPATSRGFSAVDFATDVLGVDLFPWQRWLLIHAMELRPDGRFRYRTVLILVARQNGKTTFLEVKNLWKLFVLKVKLVIGTAQNLDISEESWDNAVGAAEAIPELKAEILDVCRTNGKKALKVDGGGRWKVAAASRKGGRSLSGDDVNLDELREHQTWESWGAVTKTTMARPDPQVYATTNAGDDKSVVLVQLRAQGRAAAEDPSANPSLGHFEWSANDDVRCTCGRPKQIHADDCRLQERAEWAWSNPSLNRGGITEEAIEAALNTDPEPVFRTEVLCQHVASMVEEWQVVPETPWRDAEDPASKPRGPYAVAIEMSLDRSEGCIALAGRARKKLRHVEIAALQAGSAWIVPWLVARRKTLRFCAVVVDSGGPAGSLIPDIEAAGFEVLKPAVRDLAAACGGLVDGIAGKVKEGSDPEKVAKVRNVRHIGQGQLTAAVAALTPRTVAETVVWERSGGGFMAVAAAEALWGLAKKAPDDYVAADNIW